jgi:Uma2 family endonuclease
MNAPLPRLHRFTSKEFTRIAKSGGFGDLRVELRRGMIVEMSPQYAPHTSLQVAMFLAVKAAVDATGLPLRVWFQGSVEFGEGFQPMPDIFVWDPALAPADLDGPVPGAAVKLVIEVAATTLADDLGDKLAEYAAAGLAEYWVADVQGRMVFRHDGPKADGYARRLPVALHEEIAALTLPGVVLSAGSLEG